MGGESELPQNTNKSNVWEIHHRPFNLPDQSAPFTALFNPLNKLHGKKDEKEHMTVSKKVHKLSDSQMK